MQLQPDERLEHCKDCPFFEHTEVPYLKGLTNDFMLVGQSPGKDEVIMKKPFVGASGVLQDKVIKKVGLAREMFFIANTLRCYEGDKNPTPKELFSAIEICRYYLKRAIEVIKPKLIVATGAYALKAVLNKEKITDKRGKFYWSAEFGCPVFIVLHPAAVIRECAKEYPNQSYDLMSMREKDYLQDWMKIASFIEATKTKTIDDIYWEVKEGSTMPNMDAFLHPNTTEGYAWGTERDLKTLSKSTAISFDIETEEAIKNAKPLSIAFSINKGQSRVYKLGRALPKAMKDVMCNQSINKVVAARPFDEEIIKLHYKTKLRGKIYDVLTMAHILDENYHVFNLESVAQIYADMHNIKDIAEGFRGNLKDAPPEVLLAYNGVDSDATMRSFNNMYHYLESEPKLLNYYENFMIPIQDTLAAINKNGCHINPRIYKRNLKEAQTTLTEMERELTELIPKKIKNDSAHVGKLRFSRDNLVRDIVFKGYKCKPNKNYLTDKLALPQVSRDHLKEFKHIEFVEKYLKWAELDKIHTSYLKPLQGFVDSEGCIYPSTLINRTVTGRTVILYPPVQTYPNPNKSKWAWLIRSCMEADPGWLLGARDASQSELRIVGWLANDKNILDALRNHIDLHTKTASILNKIPVSQVTKEQRDRAKPFNFGLVYGLQPKSLQIYLWEEYDIRATLEECIEIHRLFFSYPNGYYDLPTYYKRIGAEVRQKGYVESVLGRRRRFPMAKNNYEYLGQIERQAINFPVQSFSSDLALIGMMLFYRALCKNKLTKVIKPMWFIHDSIMFQAQKKYMKVAMELLKQAMEVNAVVYVRKYFNVDVGYPVETDGKIGKTWNSLK